VPPVFWQQIADDIYNVLRKTLQELGDKPEYKARNFQVVQTCSTLHRADAGERAVSWDWLNDIHPTDAGFAKLAVLISARLHALG